MSSTAKCGDSIGRQAFRGLLVMWLAIVVVTFTAALCMSATASAQPGGHTGNQANEAQTHINPT